jgi:hypothetical protein
LDAEVSAWGQAQPTDASPEPRLDADVSIAYVQQRLQSGYVRLGRQQVSGGAARNVRFDGARVALASREAVGVDAYAGWTVLPRWNQRPTYRLLGSAADARLDEAAALPDPERSGHLVLGARARYSVGDALLLGASYHEEREADALGRRNVGGDLWLRVASGVELFARAVMDADRVQLADARASLEVSAGRTLRVSVDYDRYDPSLLLSRQSVTSVFGAEAYDALGPLLLSWTRAGSLLPPASPERATWTAAATQIGLLGPVRANRLEALDAYLDRVETLLENWGKAQGVEI